MVKSIWYLSWLRKKKHFIVKANWNHYVAFWNEWTFIGETPPWIKNDGDLTQLLDFVGKKRKKKIWSVLLMSYAISFFCICLRILGFLVLRKICIADNSNYIFIYLYLSLINICHQEKSVEQCLSLSVSHTHSRVSENYSVLLRFCQILLTLPIY